MKKLTLSLLPALLFAALPSTVMACNSCMGNPDSSLAPALGASILGLVVVLAIVCGAFLKFVFFLAKRDGLPIPQDVTLK